MKKINLYILSLWLLFVFIGVLTLDIPVCIGKNCSFISFFQLLSRNVIPFFSLIFLLYGFSCLLKFKFDTSGSTQLPFQITRIENINYEQLTFLATYIVPLISFDFKNGREILVLVILLIVMGIIYIKTNLFYANPSLSLLGFSIYKVDGKFKGDVARTDIIVISQSKLALNERVSYIKLDDNIYFGKRLDNGNR